MYFIDIVGSTALATEVGDARWREQDTAGDGFFATFSEPAQALRAAVAIAAAVHTLWIKNGRPQTNA